MQVGAGPPFQNPRLVGDVGAPSAPPFGPGCRAGRSREDGLGRPGEALASGHSESPFISSLRGAAGMGVDVTMRRVGMGRPSWSPDGAWIAWSLTALTLAVTAASL